MHMRAIKTSDRTETPSGILRWEDPPEAARGGRNRRAWFEGALETLKCKPGKWALVLLTETRSKASGRSLSAKRTCKLRKLRYEWTYRALKDGRSGVYGRYVGD